MRETFGLPDEKRERLRVKKVVKKVPGVQAPLDVMGLWLTQKGWIREHKFHPVRKWRWDWADVTNKLAIEIQGGVWIGGRHTSGSGFVKDMEKYNAGVVFGWRLLAYTPQQFKNGGPIPDLEAIYGGP